LENEGAYDFCLSNDTDVLFEELMAKLGENKFAED